MTKTGSGLSVAYRDSDLIHKIARFGSELKYRCEPYSKRNWGHPLHSLCSYQGKLKPSIAHFLVREFTESGARVLDPLGGVGTIPFEACCLGREGISNDLSPLAYTVATGKVRLPSASDVASSLERLQSALSTIELSDDDIQSVDFGLNGSVRDFFHPNTLWDVVRARRFYLSAGKLRDADLFVRACVLHVLHGNRPYALSRTSHPITPFHPQGPFVDKSVLAHTEQRIARVLKTPPPATYVTGASFHGDFRALPNRVGEPVDAIITSPPFLGMRFDRPNWLRLWFCGWGADDFHRTSRAFLERQQTESLDVYREFFATCEVLLRPGGLCVIHIGGSPHHKMVASLREAGTEKFGLLGTVVEDVSDVEHHGIKDKGLTTTHEFLFFRKFG